MELLARNDRKMRLKPRILIVSQVLSLKSEYIKRKILKEKVRNHKIQEKGRRKTHNFPPKMSCVYSCWVSSPTMPQNSLYHTYSLKTRYTEGRISPGGSKLVNPFGWIISIHLNIRKTSGGWRAFHNPDFRF